MYTHCMFCHADMGRNESVEAFFVGRRLAFDGARGRLWVVCSRCERWNLTPLEERWEAIEQCERLYRATRLRATTENIGLARLKDGLDLVRIGNPLRPEFAAWRYGDQFGRRRRRRLVRSAVGLGVVGAFAAGVSATGIAVGSMGGGLFNMIWVVLAGRPGKVVALLPLAQERITVRRKNLGDVRMWPAATPAGWSLRVTVNSVEYEFDGDQAVGLLGGLMPHLNQYGAPASRVKTAVTYLESLPSPMDAFRQLAIRPSPPLSGLPPGLPEHAWLARTERWRGNPIAEQPSAVKLALEMAAHEDSELRALHGELAVLERSWKDAEAIAAISDQLSYGPGLERVLLELKRRSVGNKHVHPPQQREKSRAVDCPQ